MEDERPWYKKLPLVADYFVMRKNAWHVKLMKMIWNYDYHEFSNMCPYFWLTVLNVLIFVPFIVFRGIAKVLGIFFGWVIDAIDEYERKCALEEEEKFKDIFAKFKEDYEAGDVNKITSNRYYQYIYDLNMKGDYKKRHNSIYNFWSNLTWSEKDAIGDMFKEKRYQEDRAKIIERRNIKTRRQEIAASANLAKNAMRIVGVLVSIVLAYGLFKLIVWSTSWNWAKIGHNVLIGLLALIVLVVGIVIVGSVIKIIGKLIAYVLCKFGPVCLPCIERRDKIGSFFSAIWDGIKFPFIFIFSGFVMLIQVVIAMKKNHCPGIEWVEDEKEAG